MTPHALSRCWLEALHTPPGRIEATLERLEQRIAARAAPARLATRLVELAAEWCGPALLLGRAGRASRLEPAERDRLLDRLHAHPDPLIRGAGLLVLAPLFEALFPEHAGPPPPHPLDREVARTDRVPAHADVVVVGSGAGGAPLAWALATAGLEVVVLEQGGLVAPQSAADAVARHYLHHGLVGSAMGGLSIVLAARAVGGTTPVNSGTCLRPLPAFHVAWAHATGAPLDPGELDDWLALAEHELRVGAADADLQSTSGRLFAEGLELLGRGAPTPLPRNAPACTGSGRCCFGCPASAKRSADRSFLPDAVAAGARLLAGARVHRIETEGDGVVVRYRHRAADRWMRARHVVIAAGALETPGLLARCSALRTRRWVGRGMRIHPTGKVFAWFPGVSHGGGGVPQGLGYRPPELPRVALEGIHTPPAVSAPLLSTAGRRAGWWLERHSELASFGLMIADRGEGRVQALGGYHAIDYRLDDRDANDMVRGMQLIGEAFFAAGAERVLLPLAGVTCEFESAAELARLDPAAVPASAVPAVGFHPQGTAAVGLVVGPGLRLPGCARISVCDASVLPGSPGVNPQLTVMALALRHAASLTRALRVS